MDLDDWIRLTRRWLPLALLAGVLASAITYGVTKLAIQPVYTATVIMQVQIAAAGQAGLVDPEFNTEYAQTEAAVAQEPPNVNQAIALAKVDLASKPTDRRKRQFDTPSVSCSPRGVTSLFSCDVTSRYPPFAVAVASRLGQVFIRSEQNWQGSRYKQVLNRILGQERQARAAGDTVAFNSLVQLENSVRVSLAQRSSIARVIAPPVLPDSPSSPHPTLNAAIAFVIVAILTLAGGGLAYRLDDSVRGDEDLKAITGLPILAAVPEISALLKRPAKSENAIVATDPRSYAAEAFRMARTNILFAQVDNPLQVLLVVSAFQSEGKSTVAANLAASFAEMGKSVIAVDLDLRRPSIAKIFDAPHRGLTHLMLDGASGLSTYLVPTAFPNLRILPAGVLPPNPAELLGSHRMTGIFSQLRASADVVIVDVPPLLPVADAAIIAPLCDAFVLVARPNLLKRHPFSRAVETLRNSNLRGLGVVLNALPNEATSYSYSYESYRYYANSYYDSGGAEAITSTNESNTRPTRKEASKR